MYTKIDNLPRILSVSWPTTMTHVVNPEIKFQPGSVSLATFAAHMLVYNPGLTCDGQT